jgi:DNA-binding protein
MPLCRYNTAQGRKNNVYHEIQEQVGGRNMTEVNERNNDENTIFVGSKPPMSYVLAVVTQFSTSGSDEVVIKARGQAISRAVDTAEIVRNRFVKDAKIQDIIIGTETMTNEENRTSNVSSIEIHLSTKIRMKKYDYHTGLKKS